MAIRALEPQKATSRAPLLPGIGLPQSPCCAQELARRSLREVWPEHKHGDRFHTALGWFYFL